jgi:serine/threonine-protein kinase ULK2
MMQISSNYVIKMLDITKTLKKYYFLLEYCNSGNLRQFMTQTGDLKESEVRLVLTQIIQGVAAFKTLGIIHRDIKPENIMLHNNSDFLMLHSTNQSVQTIQFKIGDFGSARYLNEKSVSNTVNIGTPLYSAPEVLMGLPYDSKADVWSIGCIAYELFTK